MIQAIENNYEVPLSYVEGQSRQVELQRLQSVQDAIVACSFCDDAGFRNDQATALNKDYTKQLETLAKSIEKRK